MNRFCLILCAAFFNFAQGALAQNVLTNGDFEQSPPSGYGNHIGWSIAPWILTAGSSNVVEVDGPGGLTWYNSNGPASDATGGAGRPQHYFDQANISGIGTIYQEFTPLCDGDVSYGTYFSTRGNAGGTASVWIMDATGGSIVAGPATVTIAGGNSELDPWQLAAFTAVLTAGTTYRFRVDMDNQLNMDNAYVEFGPECTAYTDGPVQCLPFEQAELTCDQTTGSYVIQLQNSLAGTFDPTDLTLTTASPGISISQSQTNPLEFMLTGASPGQTLTLATDAVQTGVGDGVGLDLCCVGEVEITIPEGMLCEGPLDVSVSKVWQDFIDTAGAPHQFEAPPHGFEVTVDLNSGALQPGDVVTVRDPVASQINVTSFGTPAAPAPWTCSMSGASWECQYVVPATGAVLPASILWLTTIDSEQHVKNCADMTVTRGGESLPETDDLNNQSCWEINVPDAADQEPRLSIDKTGPESCQTGEICQYTYTVSNAGPGPYNGPITLADRALPVSTTGQQLGGYSGGNFVSISPPLCPMGASLVNGGCSGTVSIPAGGSITYTVGYAPPEMLGEGDYDIENCVDLSTGEVGAQTLVGTDCHNLSLDPPALDIVKTGPAACDLGASCDFDVTITNTSTQPYTGNVALTDQSNVSGFAVTNVTPMPPGCGGTLPANPFSCVLALSNFGPGATQSYTFTMTPLSAFGQVVADSGENCASLIQVPDSVALGDYSWNGTGQDLTAMPTGFADLMQFGAPLTNSCAQYESTEANPTPTDQDLTVTKQSISDCIVDQDSQSYFCQFGISVNNPGPTAQSGPFVVTDGFGTPPPIGVGDVSGAGWTCTTGSSSSTSCLLQGQDIPPGGWNQVAFTVELPGLPAGGSFQNCAALAMPTDDTQETKILQAYLNSVGIDVGPADGQIGPNTTAGIITLQQNLGLPETGVPSADLYAAAGLQGGMANPSCVTVSLPPMPVPALICDAATTVRRDGACVCRFSQMYEQNAGSCSCVRGTEFVAGEGCVRTRQPTVSTPRPQVSTPTEPAVTPRPLRCDSATTVARGGACECRYPKMFEVSATACACEDGSPLVRGRGCVSRRQPSTPGDAVRP